MKFTNAFCAVGLTAITIVGIQSCSKDTAAIIDDTPVADDGFVTNTKDTTFSNAVIIKYSGTTATVTNPYQGNGVNVAVTNGEVVVTATTTTTEINYVLSGRSTNGTFKIYSDYKFGLILNGASIINVKGPAINIQSSKKVSVSVVTGTNNRLIDGATYAASSEDQKGAFFSEGQLIFSGKGSLAVTGKYKHGICSDGYIYIQDGNITISQAVTDGMHANDYVKIDGGTVAITSSADGIDCEAGYVAINGGSVTVNSVDDGITTSYTGTDVTIVPYVTVNGGVINIITTGDKGNAIKSKGYTLVNSNDAITLKVSGKASKGFKTTGDFTLTNGNITITTTGNAYYDTTDKDIAAASGINCDKTFTMAKGTLSITSSGLGGKGISVDNTMTINGGTINITASGSKFTYGTTSSEAKGIKCDNELVINNGVLNISAADDGMKSEKSITINGGTVTISKSYEGIEAPKINLLMGTVTVVSTDDCLNSTNGNGGEANDGSLMTIAGGTIALSSSGGDSMDSNGSIVMTGGTVIAQGPPSAPEVALDYNGTFNISGGLFIASGPNSGNMIQATSTSSTQNAVLAKTSASMSTGTLFNIQDASGNTLVTYAPARNAYYFVFSSPSLQSGSSFKIFTGGTITGATSTNGLYIGGNYSGGTQKSSFTPSSKVTSVTF